MIPETNGIDKQANYFAEEAHTKWIMSRWGKFSASEISDLMTPGKVPKGATVANMFSDAGETLIKRIAIERFTRFHETDNGMSFAMKKGKMLEPAAFAFLQRVLGIPDLTYHGGHNPVFIPYGEDAGASPDAALYAPDGSIMLTCEIKCREDKAHWDFLEFIREKGDMANLADYSFQDYCQCQMNILAAGIPFAFYICYNEYFPANRRGPVLKVMKDAKWQTTFKIRLKEAVKRCNQMVENQKSFLL